MLGDDSEKSREGYCAASPISTETLAAVGIEIDHFKVVVRMGADQNQPIGSDPKLPVTEGLHQLDIGQVPVGSPIIEHHKVIAGALVLVKAHVLG
jgi:hypothetical protein